MTFLKFFLIVALLSSAISNTVTAETLEVPVIANASFYDSDGDGVFTSVASLSSIIVWWRNINFLSQRHAYRSALEIDLSNIPEGAIIDQANIQLFPTKKGDSPTLEFRGYIGDGMMNLTDADAGDILLVSFHVNSLSEPLIVDITSYMQSLLDSNESILGLNLRVASEGNQSNTFDDEIRANGFQSTSQVFLGPKVVVEFSSPKQVPIPFIFLILCFLVILFRSISINRF